MLEPADSAEALAFTRRAYEISEEFDTPVILKMCTRVAHSQSIVETSPRTEGPGVPYEKNIAKYVMMPGNAIRRHPVVEDRMRRLAQYAETCDLNRVEMGGHQAGHHYLQHLLPVCEGGLWGGSLCPQAGGWSTLCPRD